MVRCNYNYNRTFVLNVLLSCIENKKIPFILILHIISINLSLNRLFYRNNFVYLLSSFMYYKNLTICKQNNKNSQIQFPFNSKSLSGQIHLRPFGELTKQAIPAGATEHSW